MAEHNRLAEGSTSTGRKRARFTKDNGMSDADNSGASTPATGAGTPSGSGTTINLSALARRAASSKASRSTAEMADDAVMLSEESDSDTSAEGNLYDSNNATVEGPDGIPNPVSFDYTWLNLKPDHPSRPIWITPGEEGARIILEAFSPIAEKAQDFLTAVSEPKSRPAFIHEYELTKHSLNAAVSVGLEPEDIIDVLNRMSKVPVSTSLANWIRKVTSSYGKVKLVLKQNRYFVESSHAEVLQILLKDDTIRAAKVRTEADDQMSLNKETAPRKQDLVIAGTRPAGQDQVLNRPNGDTSQPPLTGENTNGGGRVLSAEEARAERQRQADQDLFTAVIGVGNNDEFDEDDAVHSFEIAEGSVEAVKRRCSELEYPLQEEYDCRNDKVNPDLDIELKPITVIRPYQEKSLSKMFSNGRARSGIIVLPCGAGKTLVGIVAACTIKKSCLVLCTSSVSVMQWKKEFMKWSNIQDNQISVFTADQKEKFTGAAGIVVSTYSMVANTGKRSHDSQKMMNFLTSREWGFILLDEVHVVPAAMFRRVMTSIKAHAKLGLTATLVREDEKIEDLNYLIGPKLYEANWMDLAQNGHIANVQCAEVWCPMTPTFYAEYLRQSPRKKMLLWCMNPRKFQACQFLIDYHEKRGDKIIVFSDNVYALEAYAKRLKKPYIHGGTAQVERMRILQYFQHDPQVNTIFLSKVGDTSIDLPEATCLIQISSHFGSRRQEAQRLGRILRAKRRNDEGFNAFFYSLVSKDTQEMYYSTKRQKFLIDQGYAFRVVVNLDGMDQMADLVYKTESEQIELLQTVLVANESEADIARDVTRGFDDLDGTITSKSFGGPGSAAARAKRTTGSLTALSGGQAMSYIERNRSENKRLAREGDQPRNRMFAKRAEQAKRARREAQQ